MIRSFRDVRTRRVFERERVPRLPVDVRRQAHRKLLMIDAAARLEDLRSPPGNRLELLRGDRKGQHSIRINDQWRVCFVWRADGAHEVEICEYH
jgi:proteic killer suppression protein